jgi:hypothetical protein
MIGFNASIIIGNMGELLDFGPQSHDNLEDDMNQDIAMHLGPSIPLDQLSINQVNADKEVGKIQ